MLTFDPIIVIKTYQGQPKHEADLVTQFCNLTKVALKWLNEY